MDWGYRMVVVQKHDGTARRGQPAAPQQALPLQRVGHNHPVKEGQPVPKDSFMAINNAWNGCHSVLLRILDQHLTSFITLWGHNCYCRNPQGFVGAGDGYNRHFDAVLTNFAHKERCNDDTIFWGRNLESHW